MSVRMMGRMARLRYRGSHVRRKAAVLLDSVSLRIGTDDANELVDRLGELTGALWIICINEVQPGRVDDGVTPRDRLGCSSLVCPRDPENPDVVYDGARG